MTLLHPRETALLHYAAGSTGESARRRLAQHLADCDRCRRVVVSTRELRATLAGASEIASSDALFARILASRAAGARVLLPVESPPEAGANRAARPALWVALAGAAAIAFVSLVPTVWAPSATSSSAAEAPPHRSDPWQKVDPTIPGAGPIIPTRMHEVTLRYGFVSLPGGGPRNFGSFMSYRFVRSGAVGSDWILISEHPLDEWYDSKRRPDSIWIDAATLGQTRWSYPGETRAVYSRQDGRLRVTRTFQPSMPASVRAQYGPSDTSYLMPAIDRPIVQDRAHFIALMMTIPLTQHWRGGFARLAVGKLGVLTPSYDALQITGSRTVITGVGRFDCWEVADRQPEGTHVRWFRKSDGLFVGEEFATAPQGFAISGSTRRFKILLVSEE